jgi:hypothetical protein
MKEVDVLDPDLKFIKSIISIGGMTLKNAISAQHVRLYVRYRPNINFKNTVSDYPHKFV